MTEQQLAEILKRNPDIKVIEFGAPPPLPPTAHDNPLAARFLHIWRLLGGPALYPEFRFHPTRRWRFDFAHELSRVAIELNGGVWSHGRHTRGKGYLADREKINAATALGWRVFELGTGQINVASIQQIIDAIDSPNEL